VAIVVIGVNHRTTPLALFERLTVDAADLPKALADVLRRDHVSETVVLSTCNRTEIYAVVERFHDSYTGLRDALAARAYVPVAELADHVSLSFDEAAARHLFDVAAGLDSAVVGETEILGQIKTAWEVARVEGASGPLLNAMFRHALEVGKRARTETAISRHIASASAAAVAMAAEHLDGLAGRRVLVMGAGDMGEGMAVSLAEAGVAEVRLANRTFARAEALAARVGGTAVPLHDLRPSLAEVDLLLTSTGAAAMLVDHVELAPVIAAREGRPLLIVDIAVPRDVDPEVASLPGVTLLDMDDLRRFADAGIERRRGEVAAVGLIVEEELVRFAARTTAREVAPLIADLHQRAEQLRLDELQRFAGRLEGLTDRQREAVEALTHGIIAKVLHQPSVRLKDLSGSARGDRLVEALRDLYELDGD
jgi:glutamyl-tRNA reductase